MRTMAGGKKKPDGLKIQLRGFRSTPDLRNMLNLAVDEMEARGIRNARGVNLYLTPADGEGNQVFPRKEDGSRLAVITIEAPYRSAADEHGV